MVALELLEALTVELLLIGQARRVVSCDLLGPGAFRLSLSAGGGERRSQPRTSERPSDDRAEEQPDDERENVAEVHVGHCASGL